MFYKIINQYVDVPCDYILQKPFNFTRSGSIENCYTYLQELMLLILSFLEQSAFMWNHLPDHTVKPDVNINSLKPRPFFPADRAPRELKGARSAGKKGLGCKTSRLVIDSILSMD